MVRLKVRPLSRVFTSKREKPTFYLPFFFLWFKQINKRNVQKIVTVVRSKKEKKKEEERRPELFILSLVSLIEITGNMNERMSNATLWTSTLNFITYHFI